MYKTSYSPRYLILRWYLCLHYNWKCTKFFYGVLFIAPKVDELVFEPSQYCKIVWIVHYHLWLEWWGKIGRKGCVNQDGCIMHEWGARRPGHRGRAFFSPQRAPVLCTDHLGNKTSVTLQFSESRQWSWWQKSSTTILKIKICKCAVLWKWKV